MTTTIQTREVDPDLLNAFIGQMVGDLGATVSAGLVLIGDRLGIYRAMADGTPVTAETLAEPHRPRRRLPAAVAREPGVRRVRHPPRRGRRGPVCVEPGAGRGPRRPGQPGLLRPEHAGRRRRPAGRRRHRRPVPHRRRLRLARARRRPVRRHRTVLQARLRREPRRRLAARARRRRPQARGRGSRRRRRLRTRRVDGPHGRGLPALRRSSAPTTTRPRSSWPAAAPRRPASPANTTFVTVDALDLASARRRRLRPRDDVRLPPRHGRPGRRRPPDPRLARPRRRVHARRAARPATTSRTTSTRWAASSTAPRPSSAPRARSPSPVRRPSAPRPVPPRITAVLHEAGFRSVRIAAETPVNHVYEARD